MTIGLVNIMMHSYYDTFTYILTLVAVLLHASFLAMVEAVWGTLALFFAPDIDRGDTASFPAQTSLSKDLVPLLTTPVLLAQTGRSRQSPPVAASA
jgi:hypothetical protein